MQFSEETEEYNIIIFYKTYKHAKIRLKST